MASKFKLFKNLTQDCSVDGIFRFELFARSPVVAPSPLSHIIALDEGLYGIQTIELRIVKSISRERPNFKLLLITIPRL